MPVQRSSRHVVMAFPQLISYTEGRDGYVVYQDEKGLMKLYFEFGGGDCVAIVHFPTAEEWAKIDQRTSAERRPVMEWIAGELLRTEMKGGSYLLKEDCIEFYGR